ncbi:hypothetical protein BHM03_00049843 [Ensete ventricosum]|nr:hypothetical protein BHM03_00049843 [Ensete ventricosum]
MPERNVATPFDQSWKTMVASRRSVSSRDLCEPSHEILSPVSFLHPIFWDSMLVFDLGEEVPDKVLQRLYANFEKLKAEGDKLAEHIERTLRVIVAGGDGTAGWLLGVVCDLKLAQPPPIATVPLGTGNNLPFSFGWVRQGKKNPGTDPQSVKFFLDEVKKAKEMKIDRYCSVNSFSLVGHCFATSTETWILKFYLRTTYARLGATQGWFLASLFHPSSSFFLIEVNMLATRNCISKSINDPSTPSAASHHGDEDSEDSEDEWEGGRKKFGAAETFKLPEDLDIAHLS